MKHALFVAVLAAATFAFQAFGNDMARSSDPNTRSYVRDGASAMVLGTDTLGCCVGKAPDEGLNSVVSTVASLPDSSSAGAVTHTSN